MSENNSAKKPRNNSGNKKRYKKNYRNKNNNNNSGGGNNKKRHHNKNRNRRPKSLTPARILQKYDNLLEQYVVARRKYYELFGRAGGKQLDKVERNYQTSLKNLRDFEDKLEDWQREVLDQKINLYKEDRDYSTNNNISPEGDTVSFTGEFEDPHLLPTQKATEWSKDTEESEGTMEDYEKYKAMST